MSKFVQQMYMEQFFSKTKVFDSIFYIAHFAIFFFGK